MDHRFEILQKWTPVAPSLGDRGPVARWSGDRVFFAKFQGPKTSKFCTGVLQWPGDMPLEVYKCSLHPSRTVCKRCVRIFHIQNADTASTFTSAFLQKDQDRLFHWKLLRSIYHLISIFFWEIHSIFLSDHIFCICLDSEKAANVLSFRFIVCFNFKVSVSTITRSFSKTSKNTIDQRSW